MISVSFQFTGVSDDDGHCAEYELDAVSYDARIEDFDVTAVDSEGRYVEPTVEMYQEARRRLMRELYAVQTTVGGEGDYVRQVEWEY